jgi:hypothetical protein
MLLRLVVLFVVGYVIFRWFRSLAARGGRQPSNKLRPDSRSEDMVLDPQCQSYVAKSNAVAVSGRYFCSQECARLYLER